MVKPRSVRRGRAAQGQTASASALVGLTYEEKTAAILLARVNAQLAAIPELSDALAELNTIMSKRWPKVVKAARVDLVRHSAVTATRHPAASGESRRPRRTRRNSDWT